jgi:hypothetical protein
MGARAAGSWNDVRSFNQEDRVGGTEALARGVDGDARVAAKIQLADNAAITRVKANAPALPRTNGKGKQNGKQAEAKLEWKRLLAACADSGCDPAKLAAFYQVGSLAQLPPGQLALAMTLATRPTAELMIDFEVEPSVHG